MKKAILFILTLAFPLMANAQYAPAPDYTQTKEFKVADTMAKTGIGILIASGVGITTGNIICVVQENKYINANLQSGESAFVSGSYVTGSNSNAEKILALKDEARQQPGYKTGLIIEGVSFGTALVGAALTFIRGAMKNASVITSDGRAASITADSDNAESLSSLSLSIGLRYNL